MTPKTPARKRCELHCKNLTTEDKDIICTTATEVLVFHLVLRIIRIRCQVILPAAEHLLGQHQSTSHSSCTPCQAGDLSTVTSTMPAQRTAAVVLYFIAQCARTTTRRIDSELHSKRRYYGSSTTAAVVLYDNTYAPVVAYIPGTAVPGIWSVMTK